MGHLSLEEQAGVQTTATGQARQHRRHEATAPTPPIVIIASLRPIGRLLGIVSWAIALLLIAALRTSSIVAAGWRLLIHLRALLIVTSLFLLGIWVLRRSAVGIRVVLVGRGAVVVALRTGVRGFGWVGSADSVAAVGRWGVVFLAGHVGVESVREGDSGRGFILCCAEGLGRQELPLGVLGDIGGEVWARLLVGEAAVLERIGVDRLWSRGIEEQAVRVMEGQRMRGSCIVSLQSVMR